jgi:hypothetical protein
LKAKQEVKENLRQELSTSYHVPKKKETCRKLKQTATYE